MKIWIDDIIPAPEGYLWCKSVYDAVIAIEETEHLASRPRMLDCNFSIELIDIGHGAGEYADRGGDYIKLLDWLEKTDRNYPIRIHSQNPVGVENRQRIIERNNWKEIKQ